jgi:membrane protein
MRVRLPSLGRLLLSAGRAMIHSLSFELAGHIAYTGLLAIFPFLVFLAALAGFLGDYGGSLASVHVMLDMLPEDVGTTLRPVINEILNRRDGGLLTLGLLGALWVASNGIDALRIALNSSYGFSEPRPWWLIRLGSLGAILLGGVIFLLLSVLIVLGPLIWKGLLWLFPLSNTERWAFSLFRYGLAGAVLTAGLLALHRWLPGRHLRWRDLLPGVLATVALWLTVAGLFSLYVARLGNYSATYGSLGGVIVTLVFFYVSAVLFIFGAEINAALLRRRKGKKPRSAGAEALADR